MARSNFRMVDAVEQKLRVPFGAVLRPRAREERMRHVDVLGTVPFDMVQDVKERDCSGMGVVGRRQSHKLAFDRRTNADETAHLPPQFAKIYRSLETSVDALVAGMMKACAHGDYSAGVWTGFVESLVDLKASMNSADIGLVLRCLIKAKKHRGSSIMSGGNNCYDERELIASLLEQVVDCHRQSRRGLMRVSPCAVVSSFSALVAFDGVFTKEERNSSVVLGLIPLFSQSMSLFSDRQVVVVMNNASSLLLTMISGLNASDKTVAIVDLVVGTFSTLKPDLLNEHDGKSIYPSRSFSMAELVMLANCASRTLPFLRLTKRESKSSGIHESADVTLRDVMKDIQIRFLRDKTEVCGLSIEQLSTVANAFAKFDQEHEFLHFFTAVGNELAVSCYQLDTRSISVVANAFAKVSLLHEGLFEQLSQLLNSDVLGNATPRELAMISHAYVKLGLGKEPMLTLLWEVAIRDLRKFDWHSTSLLVQSYAKSGGVDDKIYTALHDQILQLISKEPPETNSLVCIVHALAETEKLFTNAVLAQQLSKVMICCCYIASYIMSSIQACTITTSRMNAQAIASVAAAFAETPEKAVACDLLSVFATRLCFLPNIRGKDLVKIVDAFGRFGDSRFGPVVQKFLKASIHLIRTLNNFSLILLMQALRRMCITDEDLIIVIAQMQDQLRRRRKSKAPQAV